MRKVRGPSTGQTIYFHRCHVRNSCVTCRYLTSMKRAYVKIEHPENFCYNFWTLNLYPVLFTFRSCPVYGNFYNRYVDEKGG